MSSQDDWIRAFDAAAMLKRILPEYSARLRICKRAYSGLVRARAEQFHFGKRIFHDREVPTEFWWAEGHEALDQDWPAGDFSTWIENGRIQLKAFGVMFARADIEKMLPTQDAQATSTATLSEENRQIIERLEALVPSAGLSYRQAILDLSDSNRVSFRGPALELREALRETLDHLAPDDEVMISEGYDQHKDRAGPTMKQKVRFIMKKKGKRSASDLPEKTVTAFEEAIANLTRAVYDRSSMAAHVSTNKLAVVQLHRLLVAIIHEVVDM